MDAAAPRVGRYWPFVLTLALQNLVVYWGHYFRGVGFPWDFSMSYYAMVSFWTAAVRQGVLPEWIPFQQMGYPFALQVQSGMNYLPLWIFPGLNLPYTLHAAIVLQCLHVFAGSVGMFVLVRHLEASRAYALVAAIAFQFFGGFYSNAEHVDIVRAFACTPWLLYVFTLDIDSAPSLPRRAILIPPVLYLFLTGAYPGNVISGGVMIALFIGLQLVGALAAGAAPPRLVRPVAGTVALALLGSGMAIPQLGPVWLFRDQFVRAETLVAVPREGIWLEHLPGLFLSNKMLAGEISMTSSYVSLPVLLLASFASSAGLKRRWVYVSLALVALVMAAGDRLPVGPILRSAVPVLGLSRFPSSDYRAFLAIPLILLSVQGLRAIVEKRLSGWAIGGRGIVCAAWLACGLAQVYPSVGRDVLTAMAVAAVALATVVMLRRGQTRLGVAGLAAVCLLIGIDAVRVLPDIRGWHEPDIDAYYLKQGWPPYTRNRGRRLVASSIFRSLPATRPPRTTPPGLVRWSGYIDGSYLTTDLTPNVLRATGVVNANPVFQQYMLREWLPILLDPNRSVNDGGRVTLTPEELAGRLADTTSSASGPVRQTHYGVNHIVYEVSLKEPRILVENETYFPGWRARVTAAGAPALEAGAANGVFRSWLLPAGVYTMVAEFGFPHVRALRLVCAASFAGWITLVLVRRRSLHAP